MATWQWPWKNTRHVSNLLRDGKSTTIDEVLAALNAGERAKAELAKAQSTIQYLHQRHAETHAELAEARAEVDRLNDDIAAYRTQFIEAAKLKADGDARVKAVCDDVLAWYEAFLTDKPFHYDFMQIIAKHSPKPVEPPKPKVEWRRVTDDHGNTAWSLFQGTKLLATLYRSFEKNEAGWRDDTGELFSHNISKAQADVEKALEAKPCDS